MSHFDKDECIYTQCYCEENIWKLCQSASQKNNLRPIQLHHLYAVFISSPDERVPMWYQQDGLIVWDYHVIAVYNDGKESLVYDLDTKLPFPCPFMKYVKNSFPKVIHNTDYVRFRVVKASDFLNYFSSDRSHMITHDGNWLAPPPSYDIIQGEKTPSKMNLHQFKDVTNEEFEIGTLLTFNGFVNMFSRQKFD
eukprot:gb/GECH01013635.1/.p1 GENE.gb/GECH01013635.1/~~gb/GECH01013635.1/.p1  ORF type:complete len:194 (+),score=37.95 gb/GECH01013635.1/:1-582(+)